MSTNPIIIKEKVLLDVDDRSKPYYVGARAYVEQIPEGAIFTVIDKEGTTTATLLDGNKGKITDVGYDSNTKTIQKINGVVVEDVVTLSDVAISNDYKDLDNIPDSVPFYNVKDYGILPDNGDVYSELYDFLADYVYDTGGTVYFPAGKYTLSYTIFIPENTTFCGDGADTEIYFDETDTTFGVGLSNAGSNVTIKNMKVSQKSTGTFESGAQNGCVGFSNNAKTQAIAGKKVHQYARAEAYNLTAENLYFDGKYPIQTENSSASAIHNVVYRNLYCPNGCVSVMASTATVRNVVMENIVCDLLRVSLNMADAKIINVCITNVECQNFYFRNSYDEDSTIIVNNLRQTTLQRRNTFVDALDCGCVNGNVTFNNCVFNAIAAETQGIHEYAGIRRFYNCIFNMQLRVVLRGSALSDTDNYDVMENCILNAANVAGSRGAVIGYGKNNVVNISNYNFYMWGDVYKTMLPTIGTAVSSTTHPSRIVVDGDKVRLSIYLEITNTNAIATLPTKLTSLPLLGKAIPITIWNSNDRSTQTQTFADIENGVLKVAETGLDNSSAYDRALCEAVLEMTALPTPSQIWALLG